MSTRPFKRGTADSPDDGQSDQPEDADTAPNPADIALERHLGEMREILNDAADLTGRCTLEQFLQRRPLQNEARGIVVHLREVINRLPDSFTAGHPDVPWQRISGMGNVTAHEYDIEVDWQIVWNALSRRAPELRLQLDL